MMRMLPVGLTVSFEISYNVKTLTRSVSYMMPCKRATAREDSTDQQSIHRTLSSR
jgi:hypothetical protein